MRLLFDHNVSPRLVNWLANLFPGSVHVFALGLEKGADSDVWTYAKDNDLVIVSKDSDFYDHALLKGYPPKLIWLRLGNCTSREVEALLRSHFDAIMELENDTSSGVLILS